MPTVEYYIEAVSSLHTDKGRSRYPAVTKHRAPHKPLLLLSVLDLIDERTIKENLIELSPELGETFSLYWNIVMPPDKKGKIVYPFFHLRKESFWHLLPKPGKEDILNSTHEISSVYRLLDLIIGAKFDDEFFHLVLNKEQRKFFRSIIIEKYFDDSIREQLLIQSKINVDSYDYSIKLLRKNYKLKEAFSAGDDYKEKVRDQGFRKAVVTAYNHRCAFCGIRMRTPDGHTVVDGAHIIPWSESHNDLPQNGLSLCKLCHWTFDEGLLSVSDKYKIITSRRLHSNENIAGHLITFDNREIFKPSEIYLWPSLLSLEYHRTRKFRKK
jgi:putative restriction endonuclease